MSAGKLGTLHSRHLEADRYHRIVPTCSITVFIKAVNIIIIIISETKTNKAPTHTHRLRI